MGVLVSDLLLCFLFTGGLPLSSLNPQKTRDPDEQTLNALNLDSKWENLKLAGLVYSKLIGPRVSNFEESSPQLRHPSSGLGYELKILLSQSLY